MRYHHNRHTAFAVQAANQRVQFIGGRRIQTGYRLIQQQDRIRCAQRARQQRALLLSARKRAIGFLPKRQNVQQRHLFARHFDVALLIEEMELSDSIRTSGQHNLLHRCGEIALRGGLLRQIADLIFAQTIAVEHTSALRMHKAEHRANQRTLARSVFADHHQIIAAFYGKGSAFHRGNALKRNGDILQRDQRHALRLPFHRPRIDRRRQPISFRRDPA